MRYIFSGLLIGFILGIIPFFQEAPSFSVFPEWESSISSIHTTRISPLNTPGEKNFIINTSNALYHVTPNGETVFSKIFEDGILHTSSGNGEYYITYSKVGDSIEFYDKNGVKYWKHKTAQYPYISQNAKNILLLIADLSGIHLIDFNANPAGVKYVEGKFCSSISFSSETDYAAVGFIDGKYYIIDGHGKLTFSGEIPNDNSVKTTAISANAHFAAIHYGNTQKDGILLINLNEKTTKTFSLKNRHISKTGLGVSNNGIVSIINKDTLFTANPDKELINKTEIPFQITAHSKVLSLKNGFAASYSSKAGSVFIIYSNEGDILFRKNFPGEEYLDCVKSGNTILVRGIDNLYSYSFAGL